MFLSSLQNYAAQLFPGTAGAGDAPRRIVVVADSVLPTLQLAIRWPLERCFADGSASLDILTQARLTALMFGGRDNAVGLGMLRRWLDRVRPTHMLFCRYGGPQAEPVLAEAKRRGIPSVYCIDDDLLCVPPEIGRKKFERYNDPERQRAIRHLLANCDQIYCSNQRLRARLAEHGIATPVTVAQTFCPGVALRPPPTGPARKIGYFGFDHSRDLAQASAGLAAVLARHEELRLELIGPIAPAPSLQPFASRIIRLPAVRDYRAFLATLAGREWDIGIAPLERTRFNMVKHHNKWVEYSAAGIATVASRGTIYDGCCDGNCGLLVADDEWQAGLSGLIADPAGRARLAANAQRRLAESYDPGRVGERLIAMLDALGA